MKLLLSLTVLVLFSCCSYSQTKKERKLEKQYPERAVKVIPNDSNKYNMPIQKTDTYRSKMPVIDTDTAKIRPK